MKKYLSIALTMLMLHAFSHSPLASGTPKEKAKNAMRASQVKSGVVSLGTGTSSRVRVVLYDKSRYDGYITEITEGYFVVADAKTGATAPIAYPEVKGIKGKNLSTGAKIGIGVAIGAAVAVIIAVLASDDDDEDRFGDPRCVTTPCP